MESHAVPQNVTTFEFHLVGDMTLKQFGYLAAGGVTGYIVYVIFGVKAPFFAWPVFILCGLVGVAFAFLPISERPLDHWVVCFFKAITSATVLKYKSKAPIDPKVFDQRLEIYLNSIQPAAAEPAKNRTVTKLMAMAQLAPATQAVVMPVANQQVQTSVPQTSPAVILEGSRPVGRPIGSNQGSIAPSASGVTPLQNDNKITPPTVIQNLTQEVKQAEQQVAQEVKTETGFLELPNIFHFGASPAVKVVTAVPAGATQIQVGGNNVVPQNGASTLVQPAQPAAPAALPTSQELQQTVLLARQAQEIQTKIVGMEHQLNQIKVSAAQPGAVPEQFMAQFQLIMQNLKALNDQASNISRQMALLSRTPTKAPISNQVITVKKNTVPSNLVLTTQPNTINGLVTDTLNNYLEGVIVVTHDKEGLPVRALKTNKLGQFVAATSLPNGLYTLTFEKDNLSFDTYQLELDGQVAPAVAVSAKKGATA